MIQKIIAGVVLWLIFALLMALFSGPTDAYDFWQAFLGANLLMVMCFMIVILITKVIPWALQTLLGG